MPATEPQRGGGSWARRVRAAATERLAYKGSALFFALVLWIVVRAEEPSEELVPVRLEASFDSMRTLTGARPAIRALVVGRARDLIKLYDTPPVVRRGVAGEAPDSVRLELRPADVFLPAGVEAVVRDIQPRAVWLTFEVNAVRRVPVVSTVRITLDSAFEAAGESRLEPESVMVTGRRTAVARVTSVRTRGIDLFVHDTTAYLVPLDTVGLGVRVRPSHVAVRVPRAAPASDSASLSAAPRGSTP